MRLKKFAVFDIDGTLIRWQLYHAIADALVTLGFVEVGTYDSVKAERMKWKRRTPDASFKTYELELVRVYDQVLQGITADQLEAAVHTVFDEYKDQVYTYTRNLITNLKTKGYLLFAISGSQSEIVELMAKHYGFDDFIGTVYERAGGRFTGKSVFHAAKKDQALKRLVAKHCATYTDSLAVGDSKSDAVMLEMVENPIAFNPDDDLYKIAQTHAWNIVLERKNMIYELESRHGKYELVKTNVG